MICNIAFLIAKDKKEEFELALEQLDKEYTGLINFKLVGPLPPYSFATFEIKKLTPAEIAYAKAFLGLSGTPVPEEVSRLIMLWRKNFIRIKIRIILMQSSSLRS